MQATKAVIENTKDIMMQKHYNITIDITVEQGRAIIGMLEGNGKLSDETMAWVCATLSYYPGAFLRNDADYNVDIYEEKAVLWFTILIFSPLTLMTTLKTIDRISGGYQISHSKLPKDNDLVEISE